MSKPRSTQPTLRPLGYGHQCIDEADRQAVLDVLKGDWLTQGPMVERFEAALATRFGSRHAVVCSNGTAALHLAALALGWGPGDLVIVPAITFLATANCVAYVGAQPHFVDIDDRTLTIDPNDVEEQVKRLRAQGRSVRGVIGVDMAGHPCDWAALRQIADRYDLSLVDDACHAMGATYDNGVAVGSCTDPHLTVLSFHPVKHITTGEGGAVLTNEPGRAEHLARLRNHGTVRGPERIADWDGPWHYDMVELGFNYRLTDLQCALGLSQLTKLDEFLVRRRTIAAAYNTRFGRTPQVRCPEERAGCRHAYHLYIARIDFDRCGVSRRDLFERCRERALFLQVHYRPLFLNTFYRCADAAVRLPVSSRYYRETISLPMFPQLCDDDIERVVKALRDCLNLGRPCQ